MSMKSERQQLIMKLVSSTMIHNQDELQSLLLAKGMEVTQATLSRDVNELGLVKYRAEDGSLCYRRRSTEAKGTPSTTAEGIVSIEFSGSFAVVKTHPGFASVVASAIDRGNSDGVMGTIAGDDTIFVLLRQFADKDEVLNDMNRILPGITNKLF